MDPVVTQLKRPHTQEKEVLWKMIKASKPTDALKELIIE